MNEEKIKVALLFDLDGTLWDALESIRLSWNKAMKDNGYHYNFDLKTMKSFMGLTPEETVPLAFKDVDFNKGMELFKICLKEEISYLKDNLGALYPNEIEVLTKLANNYPLFVVSNADCGYIENYINGYKLNNLFKSFICAGDTKLAKWQNMLYIKDKFNIEKIIYIGDTKKDMIESEKAGALFIHAAYGFGEIENDKYFIKNLTELPSLVEKLCKS